MTLLDPHWSPGDRSPSDRRSPADRRSPSLTRGLDLARHGDAPAVVLDDRVLSHADLDGLVRDRADQLGDTRRLVLIECANELEPLVTYLAALAGGHPALLVPARGAGAGAEQWDRILSGYDPDVLLRHDGADWTLDEVRPGTRHELHPDLALLLGTSGSTGTPKLVRLSHENVLSNADAIASYLRLGPDSRAATTLPLQYCYGLSVVNSHLLAGGSLWLTDSSVVDAGFWTAFADAEATSFAGVPYTFDLLDRSGVDWAATPSLRQVTQAGGALPADRVRELGRLGERHGFDFFVMYGQTEATARMAYLPAHLAVERAGTIGVPIEGGEFRLDPAPCSEHGGELVYSGPNVMLGYAECPADLALGRTVHELRTGDLAVQHDDGLYQITGRCNRLAKLFGTRLDLDLVEQLLADNGIEARAVATTRLVAFVRSEHRVRRTRLLLERHHCLPPHAVDVRVLDELPVTASGKPDYGRLRRLAAPAPALEEDGDVAAVLSTVLGRPVQASDSFAGLGGDSLSYVEVSVRLERLIGDLPADWPQRTVGELAGLTRRPRRHLALLEVPVLLRAVAIVLIVGSHTELFDLMGGAHVLLGLVGFNVARFALSAPSRSERLSRLGSTLRDVLVPTVVWIGAVALVSGKYDWSTAAMLNEWVGSDEWTDQWQFWFLDVVVWGTAAVMLLLALPRADAVQRRRPFAFPLGLLAATLLLRFALTGLEASSMELYQLATAAWCLPLGWLIAASRTLPQRLLATALVPLCAWGYFGDTSRELVVIVGLLALLWIPAVLVPRVLVRPLGCIAAASFFIYLTHWVVYPPLDADHDFWAAVASVAGGLVAWQAYARLRPLVARSWRRTLVAVRPANVAGVAPDGV
jgi:hypothetical protein